MFKYIFDFVLETGTICCNNSACVSVSIIYTEWSISIRKILCTEVSSALVHMTKILNIVDNLRINVFLIDKNSLYRSSCSEVFCSRGVLRNFAKFTANQWTGFYTWPATFLKKRLWQRYFPVNFAKFSRTPPVTAPDFKLSFTYKR